jgi:imidazoleglycerol-phosphate dehydratase
VESVTGMGSSRIANISRNTLETSINIDLKIDGSGQSTIRTGVPFFDHMLTLFSKHSLMDLKIEAKGDIEVDYHHTVEDTGIVLGQCLNDALGDRHGLRRYGWALLPMDESLAQVAVDLGGRPYLGYHVPDAIPAIGTFDFLLIEEFLRAFSNTSKMNLHVGLLAGRNNHHQAEAIFKGLAKALDQACQVDPRVKGIPSSKGTL